MNFMASKSIRGEERAQELVGAAGGGLRPADGLGGDLDALVRVVAAEARALEDALERALEHVALALDEIVCGVGDEADPLGRQLVEAHEDMPRAFRLDDHPRVAEDGALDLT